MRRVGVELELGGLELETVAQVVKGHVGGRLQEKGRYEVKVSGDEAGPWSVELDFAWLKELGQRHRDPNAFLTPLADAGERALRSASKWLIPVEVVSPPLPMDRLGEVDALIEKLRNVGAEGTDEALFNAFGLQLNPEMPATDAGTLLFYLQAFLCISDWLQWRAEVDLTRQLTFFVDPFPKEYVRRVVDCSYRPDLSTLIDDYLDANPTRNRALDCLPLFLHLDEQRVRAVVDDPRVKPRPTLHYRLPNSEIGSPGWGLGKVWTDWLQLEYLAAEPDRLRSLCGSYVEFLDRPLGGLLENWAEKVKPWLKPTEDL